MIYVKRGVRSEICYAYAMFSIRNKRNTFFCFSPPVMLATFIIEIMLAAYTMWRYKLTEVSRLVVAILCFLGLFQLSEYFVCGGAGMNAVSWSRVGYAAITILPPLGLHLLFAITKEKQRLLVWLAYATGVAFIIYFLLHDQAFSGHACTGNYVIFQLQPTTTMLYALYYYGWLLAAIGLGLSWRRTVKNKSIRQGIIGLIIGYCVFLVPTSIAVIINPNTLSGIPSIMCGFAVLFALILALHLLPTLRVSRRKK